MARRIPTLSIRAIGAAAAMVLAVDAVVVAQHDPESADRPNIILVLTDDLATGDLTLMPSVQSLLVDEGMSFTNHIVSTPLCCPSRMSILRGQYAHNTGVRTNRGTTGGFPAAWLLGVEDSTIATWLDGAGYRTAHLGKYLNGYPRLDDLSYVPPGWDEWVGVSGGVGASQFGYTLNENGEQVPYGTARPDYGTDVFARKAIDIIRESASAGDPLFMSLNVYAPHEPSIPAPRHRALLPTLTATRSPSFDEEDVSDKPSWIQARPRLGADVKGLIDTEFRDRALSLLAVDEAVAAIVDALDDEDLLSDTYIVFTSDNGYHLGQHRLVRGKETPYEEDIRVPLVVRGPGVPHGETSALTGNIDLGPTFAALASTSAPEFVDGRSLVPLLTDERVQHWRQSLLIERWLDTGLEGTRLEPPDPSSDPAVMPQYSGIRTGRYAYVEYDTGVRELYDLERDPFQLDNIVSVADPALLAALSSALDQLVSCAAETCREAEDADAPG